MKWYLIWYFTVLLPNGSSVDTIEDSFPMSTEYQCVEAMDIKLVELEFLIGTSRWVAHRTVAPTGGRGMVTGVTVGCMQR